MRSASRHQRMQRCVTNFVIRMKIACGGLGSLQNISALLSITALSPDIRTLLLVKHVSVDNESKLRVWYPNLTTSPSSFILWKFLRCPPHDCHEPHKCKGNFVDSFEIRHLEDCIKECNDNHHCKYYTLEKNMDHCVLYEDCHETTTCDSCASGKKYCSIGYHGTSYRR